MDDDARAFYRQMAYRLLGEGDEAMVQRLFRVARMLSWVPKPEQPNPMYRPVKRG